MHHASCNFGVILTEFSWPLNEPSHRIFMQKSLHTFISVGARKNRPRFGGDRTATSVIFHWPAAWPRLHTFSYWPSFSDIRRINTRYCGCVVTSMTSALPLTSNWPRAIFSQAGVSVHIQLFPVGGITWPFFFLCFPDSIFGDFWLLSHTFCISARFAVIILSFPDFGVFRFPRTFVKFASVIRPVFPATQVHITLDSCILGTIVSFLEAVH